MRNPFHALAFPIKLILTGGIPVIFVIILSIQLNIEKEERREIINGFSFQLRQSAAINEVINCLQLERRYAFRVTSAKKNQMEFALARANTDKSLAEIESSGFDKADHFIDYTGLQTLNLIRQKVEANEGTAREVIDYYTSVILRLNNLSPLSTASIPFLDTITRELRSQRTLSQLITYLGLLRANVYNELAVKQKDADISMIAADYQLYLSLEKEYLQKSSVASIKEYIRLRKTRPHAETLDFIELVAGSGLVPANMSTEEWWDVSARAVDDLRRLQELHMADIMFKTTMLSEKESRSRIRTNIVIVLLIVVVITFVYLTIKHLTNMLNSIRTVAGNLALGITGNSLDVQAGDVIGNLADSILYIDATNIELAHAADEIGKGNFNAEVVPRSSHDVLGTALLKMKNNLEHYNAENEKKIWMQGGISLLHESMRGERTLQDICDTSLNVMARYIKAETGVFYVDQNDHLVLFATHATDPAANIRKRISPGEGISGEAVKTGQLRVITDLPVDYLRISSVSGSANPVSVAVVPLIHNERLEGLIELAALHRITEAEQDYLRTIAPSIAIALQTVRSRVRLQELLEETQSQAEELQNQHRELEGLNAELEIQTEKLQTSDEELRVQQEELEQSNRELQERSAQLEEKNVEITRKSNELAESTRYKSEFLANVSHELRTPLNSILLLSRLLYENNEKTLTGDQIEYARVIQASGTGLLSLIDEILDLSKIEAGKMTPEYLDVPFFVIASELESLFRPQTNEKQLEFRITIDERLPEHIITDKMRVQQILKNLLSNAIKFTQRGSVTLDIVRGDPARDGADSYHGNMVHFIVRDSGIGIPPEKHHLVFEAFQQADGSTKRKYGGTGLGLSISRELAKLLGGNITLESKPGAGSCFTLHLPLEPPAAGKEPQATSKTLPAAQESDAYVADRVPERLPDDRMQIMPGDKVMLIVEDDVHFAHALMNFTRDRGYKALHTSRGDEAMPMAMNFQPAGILLDIQLPIKSGWQVLDELKSEPGTRHIPVHIMSSLKMKKESLDKGAVDFIEKPVAYEHMQSVFERIEEVLRRKPGKVLIVEDNQRHATALSYYLESFRIVTEVRNSVEEAGEAIRKREVDCVILDMSVPGAKGYEMLDEVRKRAGEEKLPVIVFTGKNLSQQDEQRISEYADTVVVKTAASYQRMLDEVSLFLHVVEQKNKPGGLRSLGSMREVLEGKKVLIADDDVRNIFSLTRALEQYKMQILTADNGREAMEILSQNEDVDVVLLDMMMPEMDGYETATRIRGNPKWKRLPVIAVTAKAMMGDRDKCIRAGASDYITKPVDIDQLLSLLRVWLYDTNSR